MGLGEAAVEYTQRGLAVFPCKPGKKQPSTKNGYKDATRDLGGFNWGSHNVGIATGRFDDSLLNLLVIDLDMDETSGKDGIGTLRAWEREHGELPETWMSITPRGGYHIYYQLPSDVEFRNSVNEDLAVDIRSTGGYVVVPPSRIAGMGEYYWENDPDDYTLAIANDDVLEFVYHVQGRKNVEFEKFELPKIVKSGSRHETLHKYASRLMSKNISDDEIFALLTVANNRCKPKYPENELIELFNDVTSRYKKGLSDEAKALKEKSKKRKSKSTAPDDVSDRTDGIGVVKIDGAPCVWSDGRYRVGVREIDRVLIKEFGDLTRSKRRDLREDILLVAPDVSAADQRYIAFNNGVLDLDDIDAGLKPYDRDMYIINVIPHDYDPDAYADGVDEFFNVVSCGDNSVKVAMHEGLALCLYRSCEFGAAPVLLGKGSNGKSTYIGGISNMLGRDNYSTLGLKAIGKHFQSVQVMGKMANLGDDISNERCDGDSLEDFKKMVTGDLVYSDVKGTEGVTFRPYATMVISSNEMPSLGDTTDGMMRRMYPIPFNADFEHGNVKKDTSIKPRFEKDPEVARHLIRTGVERLVLMRMAGELSNPSWMDDIRYNIKRDNDSVLQWIDDEQIMEDDVIDRSTQSVYDDYSHWCDRAGSVPFGKTKFSRKIGTLWNLESVPGARNKYGGRHRVYQKRQK